MFDASSTLPRSDPQLWLAIEANARARNSTSS